MKTCKFCSNSHDKTRSDLWISLHFCPRVFIAERVNYFLPYSERLKKLPLFEKSYSCSAIRHRLHSFNDIDNFDHCLDSIFNVTFSIRFVCNTTVFGLRNCGSPEQQARNRASPNVLGWSAPRTAPAGFLGATCPTAGIQLSNLQHRLRDFQFFRSTAWLVFPPARRRALLFRLSSSTGASVREKMTGLTCRRRYLDSANLYKNTCPKLVGCEQTYCACLTIMKRTKCHVHSDFPSHKRKNCFVKETCSIL